ncbi:hypothetical protein EOD39_13776 [Acipenser ruthenus]|uniref:Uncharacterized protein n=1 Tax=Acipenser ruthenus TaxID=7906 RepID=A0A662YQ58_ACIRT|nr:hypothetical protein EOD39_13776 [Acipenser ruthenus]
MVVHVFLAAFVHAQNTLQAEVVNMMNVTETVVVFFMVNGYKKDVHIVDVGLGYYTVSTKFFMTTVKMNTNMSRREVLVHDKDLIKNFWEQKIDSQYQVTESEDVRMKKSALKK